MVARVLERMGATVRDRGAIYKAATQSVLLYGGEIWVVNGDMLKVLEGFHHRAARWITGMTVKCGADGEWEYPSVVDAMETADIQPIGVIIRRRHATIEERVACIPIYEMYTEADWMPGKIRLVRW